MPRLLCGTRWHPSTGNCLDEPFCDPTVTVYFEGNHGNTTETIVSIVTSLAKCKTIYLSVVPYILLCYTSCIVGTYVVVGVEQMYTDILVLIPKGNKHWYCQ